MRDQKTIYLELPLPHEENMLQDDLPRLRESLSMIDEKLHSLGQELAPIPDRITEEAAKITGLAGKVEEEASKVTSIQSDIAELGLQIGALNAAIEGEVAKRKDMQAKLHPVGKTDEFPFRADELPFGWYPRNGQEIALDTPQGQALNSLSDAYKEDWGIAVREDGGEMVINLPNAFNSDGRGYFIRAGSEPGVVQGDAIRNITGSAYSYNGSGVFTKVHFTGAFYTGNAVTYAYSAELNSNGCNQIIFDASRIVPTAEENRPINITMTPAIYLGV